MSTSAHFYTEANFDGTDWTRRGDLDAYAGCSGWWSLLDGQDDFAPMGSKGLPADLSPATTEALLDASWGSIRQPDDTLDGVSQTYFCFTLADLDAVQSSSADFTMARWGYDKSYTLSTAQRVLDSIRQIADENDLPPTQVRVIVSLA